MEDQMKPLRTLLVLLGALMLLAASCGSGDEATDAADVVDAADAMADDEAMDGDDSMTDDAMADDEAMDGDDSMTDDAMADDDSMADSSSDFPVTIESAGGTWTLDAAPQQIISLSPTATETLYAIGAGDQIVAVDSYSYFPEEAPVTDLSGFDPNVEAIIAFDPDLVVISNDANDLIASLTELDIPVLVSSAPADIEGGYATMAELGLATGHVDETADVISQLRAEIAEAYEAAAGTDVRVYHELGDSLFSASSFGFVGSVYAEMGALNIADEADVDQGGFPQLTEEYIVAADPELIVMTDQVGYTAEDLAARPGWSEITAVKNGNIVVVNADIASRWGPRLPQFIQAVGDALALVPAGS